jgi:DNA repair protein RadC
MEQLRHERQEIFMGAFFDAKCRFLGDSQITRGSSRAAFVAPAELFKRAILCDAALIIVLHNHPSGDPSPSEQDYRVTEELCEGARLLGLELSDHIVIGDNRYYSFREHNELQKRS